MLDRYTSILNTHTDIICRYNTEFEITYANKAFCDFFNIPQAELIGRYISSFTSAERWKPIHISLKSLTPENPTTTFSRNIPTPNDDNLYFKWTVTALYNDRDVLQEYQSSSRDITNEYKLTQSLEKKNKDLEVTQAELRMVLDSIPSKIWYKDDKNKILKLNDTAAKSMGMDVETVEGQNTYDLFGDSAKAYHEDDLKVINTGEPLLGIVERYTPNEGVQGWTQTDKIPFNHPLTKEKRILVVSTDITKLKEQEALLKTINKNLEDFASLVSHDLKAPLRHISIYTEQLRKELGKGKDNNTNADKFLNEIQESVVHSQKLISSFLKYTRVSPNTANPDVINFSSTLSYAVSRYKDQLEKLGGNISYPSQPIMVRGDKILLNQVLENLLENAIKYRKENRPLQISINTKKEKGLWHISIADNGSGIKSADLPHLFDLFGRAKPHIRKEGLGIGLALCKKIVILHGGDISISSNSDKGTTISFSLNAANLI